MLSGPNSPNTLGTPSRSSAPAMGLAIATWALEVNRSQGLRGCAWRFTVESVWVERVPFFFPSFQRDYKPDGATGAFAHRFS